MDRPMIVRASRIVTPEATLEGGWICVQDGLITGVGTDEPTPLRAEEIRLDEGWLLPGFIDVHCHGGMGGDFASGSQAELKTAAEFHAGHGTTTMLASLVTDSVEQLCRQLAAVAELAAHGDTPVIGSHLEGPFLARNRCGAQNPAHLIEPSVQVFDQLLQAARGTLKMITIAPELPGADEVIRAADRAGVVVALGHTDCTYETAVRAFGAGAKAATHLFNGMPSIHHRAPGPVIAALECDVLCEVICDGVHLHPAAFRRVAQAPGRVVLITDAMSAAGVGDGRFTLGGLDVTVADGQARLTEGGSLAGSTLTMDDALAWAVRAGLSVPDAAAAASANPARLLGISSVRGSIAVGQRADLVHVDDAYQLRKVMAAGSWLP